MGADSQGIDLNAAPPVAIMMVGLQGSGKTTTTAKVARRLADRQEKKKKVLMASLDVRRPAAMEQLAVLGREAQIETLPVVAGQMPPQIALRAIRAAKLGGYDVVLLDTAGRTTLDDEMMNEAAEVKRAANPHARTAFTNGGDGRHRRPHGHDAGRRQDEEPDRQCRARRQDSQAADGDHQFDDAAGAAQPDLLKASRKKRIAAAPAPRRKRSTSF